MLTKMQIRRELEKASSSMTYRQLVDNNEFNQMLRATTLSVCQELGRVPFLETVYAEGSDLTAMTNGLYTTVNVMSPMARACNSNWRRYLIDIGLTSHEAFHCLYTSFIQLNAVQKSWLEGTFDFYPYAPADCVKEAEVVKKLIRSNKSAQIVYGQMMSQIANVVEDGYVEGRGYEDFDGLVTAGVYAMNEEIAKYKMTIKERCAGIVAGKYLPITLVFDLLDERSIRFPRKKGETLNKKEQAMYDYIKSYIDKCSKELDILFTCSDPAKRGNALNGLYIKLFPIMLPLLANLPEPEYEQSAECSQENNNSCGTPTDVQGSKGNMSSNCTDNSDSTEEAENNDSDGDNNPNDENSDGNSSDDDSSEDGNNSNDENNPNDNNSDGGKSEDSPEADANAEAKNDEANGNSNETGENGSQENINSCEQYSNVEMRDIPEDEAQEIKSQIQNAINSELKGATPKGYQNACDEKSKTDVDEKDIKQKVENAKNLSSNEESMKREYDSAIKNIARIKIENREEDNMVKNLEAEMHDIQREVPASCNGVRNFTMSRPKRTQVSENRYDHIYQQVKAPACHLTKKLQTILKNRQPESYETGYLMGQRFEPSTITNRDGRYFGRTMEPDGTPDVAFAVLIDQSGSMSGSNERNARKAAILLEDVLRNLKVPFMIVGHDSMTGCDLTSYIDFERVNDNDKRYLANTFSRGGNCDAGAIMYCCQKLLKRPEDKKVLIVISDGCPTVSSGYFDRGSTTDTIKAVAHYRKLGINIFGAVVDSYDYVKAIYGDCAFDCRDYDALIKEFCKIIKRYVLM